MCEWFRPKARRSPSEYLEEIDVEDTKKLPMEGDNVIFEDGVIPSQNGTTSQLKYAVQAILSTFETGNPRGDYSAVAVLSDGAGISYGKHQATDRANSFDRILLAYIDAKGLLAAELAPYIDRLAADETANIDPDSVFPLWMSDLIRLLVRAGRDPIMQDVQNRIFDVQYWTPARQQALEMDLVLPLSMAAVYDTAIQSGFSGLGRLSAIRLRFRAVPPSQGGDERKWTIAYLYARRKWLLSQPNPVVARTVTRVDALLSLVEANNWRLETPFSIPAPYSVVVERYSHSRADVATDVR